MARYDLMHWSQRVRDQQAAARAAQPAPSVLPTPVRHPPKPRAARPKPPRDEEAEQLLRLCREGRLFELQAWVAAGKSLSVPAHYRQTPMRIALNTGFHSLIEFLLRHEENQSAKDDVLRQACWSGQRSVMQLALNLGASIAGVSFQSVIETWDRGVAQLFLEHGADPVTNAPFARAFKARVKAVLGIFLDCKRMHPALAEALQLQADMALRQACQDEDLKWVSLLMWLGANPRVKGLATDDLDSPDALEDPEYQQSALQIACRSKEPKILKRLKPDPSTDDLRELMAAAASLITTPETVAYLVSLGADGGHRHHRPSPRLSRVAYQCHGRIRIAAEPMKYGGVVGPLFSSLRRGSGPKPDRLLGQEVKTTRGDIRAFVALDAEQNAHLVISPAPASDERFRRFRLRTFRIEIRDWVVADQKVQKYLDICCVTGGEETLLRPFVAFCDDLLIDLDDGISSPEAAAFRTARRWYSFWTRESTELSQQAIRGLLGELSFLEFLIRENGSKALTAWTGPEGQDHDFQAGHEIAFEVKTSSSIPYNVECNLNQLDRGLFAKLFLVCFKVEKSAGGVSLPELVGRIDGLLRDDDAALETFGEKLTLAGYSRQRETEYGLHRFAISPAEVFLVTDGFPTITLKSFVRPPDMRVLDVRYVLEISGLPSLPLDASALSADLRRLSESSA